MSLLSYLGDSPAPMIASLEELPFSMLYFFVLRHVRPIHVLHQFCQLFLISR
jgi:hypothetical protein